MACEDAIMAQEQAILAALGEVASYAVLDGQLNLLNAEGVTLLALTPQVAPSLDRRRLAGSELQQRQGSGCRPPRRVGNHRHLCRGRQRCSGSAGCNNYITSYTVDGNNLTIGMAAVTMMFCAEPEGVMEQEAAYLAALGDGRDLFHQGGDARTAHGGRRDGGCAIEVATDSVVVAPEVSQRRS